DGQVWVLDARRVRDVHVGHAVARADLAEGVTGLDGVGNRAATVAGLRLVRVLGLLLGLVRPVLQVVTDGLVLVRLGPALGLGLLVSFFASAASLVASSTRFCAFSTSSPSRASL